MKTVIIGRAGTGKTYTLMKKLEELDPRRTIYISFTRSAIHEARKRAREKFGLEDKEIKYFRTIHSICSRLLDTKKEDLLTESEIKEFFKNNYGVIYKNQMELRDVLEKDNEFNIQFEERLPDGNKLIFLIEHIQHTTKKSIAEMDDSELKLKIFDFIDTCGKFDSLYLQFTENIIKVIRDFMRFKGKKLYYSDILLEFIKNPTIPEEIEYLIVDEFQDMTPLMYEVVKIFEAYTKEQWYAGDDLQTIYNYMGASPDFLINEYKTSDEKIELVKTRRLSKKTINLVVRFVSKNIKKTASMIYMETDREEDTDIQTWWEDFIKKDFFYQFEGKRVFFLHRYNFDKRKWKEKLINYGVFFKEMGIGFRIWTETTINLFNAILKLKNNKTINHDELTTFIENIPSNPFLLRGVKAQLKKGFFLQNLKQSEGYSKSDVNRLFKNSYDVDYIISNLNVFKIHKRRLDAIKIRLYMRPKIIESEDTIILSTIHGVKGMECEHTILNTKINDNTLKKMYDTRLSDIVRENESRIFFVGITRHKKDLFLTKTNNPLFEGLWSWKPKVIG